MSSWSRAYRELQTYWSIVLRSCWLHQIQKLTWTFDMHRYFATVESRKGEYQLGSRRRELLPSKVRSKGSQMIHDPRPFRFRQPDHQAIENLRCDLFKINQPCILVPSVEKITHMTILTVHSQVIVQLQLQHIRVSLLLVAQKNFQRCLELKKS